MPTTLITTPTFARHSTRPWQILEEAGAGPSRPYEDVALPTAELLEYAAEADALIVGMDPITAEVMDAATRPQGDRQARRRRRHHRPGRRPRARDTGRVRSGQQLARGGRVRLRPPPVRDPLPRRLAHRGGGGRLAEALRPRTARQDAGHRRLRPHRPPSGRLRPRLRDGAARPRPVRPRCRHPGARRRTGRARRPVDARRRRQPAHPARPVRRPAARPGPPGGDEAGRGPGQRRTRRPRRRSSHSPTCSAPGTSGPRPSTRSAPEPLPADHPLREAPRTLLTSHMAACTPEANQAMGAMVAEDVVRVLAGKEPHRQAR